MRSPCNTHTQSETAIYGSQLRRIYVSRRKHVKRELSALQSSTIFPACFVSQSAPLALAPFDNMHSARRTMGPYAYCTSWWLQPQRRGEHPPNHPGNMILAKQRCSGPTPYILSPTHKNRKNCQHPSLNCRSVEKLSNVNMRQTQLAWRYPQRINTYGCTAA